MNEIIGLQERDLRALVSDYPPEQRYELHALAFQFDSAPQMTKTLARLRGGGCSIIAMRKNGAGPDANSAFAARVTFITIGCAIDDPTLQLEALRARMKARVDRAFGPNILAATTVMTGTELALALDAKESADAPDPAVAAT